MLILTRKPGETIVIGDHVRLTLESVDRNTLRFWLQAGNTRALLVRTRRSEVLQSGGVRVLALGLRLGAVRLGIEAPATIAVHREEVWERIQREKKACEAKPTAAATPAVA